MSESTHVPTNASPDAVSGLAGEPVWSNGKINAVEGEDISPGADFDPTEADTGKPAKKAAAKKAPASK